MGWEAEARVEVRPLLEMRRSDMINLEGVPSRATLLRALILLATILVGFWIWHVHLNPAPASPHSINDIRRYFHPSAVYLQDEVRSGNLPLWNPHQMAGLPFLATHISGPLYPPNLLLLTILPPARALEVHGVLHLLCAGLLTGLFMRRLGVGIAAVFAASMTFMLSGALLILFYSVAYVSTCVWLPGILWATHGLVSFGRRRDVLALSSMLALAFLGGHAQGFLFEAQLAGVWALTLILTGASCLSALRLLTLGAASAFAVVGLVAVQLLPTAELLQHVPRAVEGLSLSEASDFAATADEVAKGLIGMGTRFELSALALPLALFGFFDRARRREWMFFSLAAITTGLFALGERTPVFGLYHALPAGDLFRFPYRIAFVYSFCVSVLMGLGMQGAIGLIRRVGPETSPWPTRVGLALTLLISADLLVLGRFQYAPPIPPLETRGVSPELRSALDDRWISGRVFVENFGNHHSPELPYLLGMMNGGYSAPTYEPMIPTAYTEYFRQDRLWRGFANVVPAHSKFSWTRSAGIEAFPPGGLARLLDLMSVRWYLTHEAHMGDRLGELEAFAGGPAESFGNARIIERTQALPRSYIVHEQRTPEPPADVYSLLFANDFDPRKQVVVERAIAALDPASPNASATEFSAIQSHQGERVVIEARCESRCLVVLTDLDYPGWTAERDGIPAMIHRVNGLYRAIQLEPGEHQIVYRYRPLSFRIGASVSLATLLILLGASAARPRRGPRAE